MTHKTNLMNDLELFKSIGKADFFFCNWYPESEQTIVDKLDLLGAGEFVITMAVKIKHPIADPNEIKQMLTNLK